MGLIEKALRAKAAVEAAAAVFRESSEEENPPTSGEHSTVTLTFTGTGKGNPELKQPDWPKFKWSLAIACGLPDGLPFVNGRQYIMMNRDDLNVTTGEIRSQQILYADRSAIEILTRTVASAEDGLAAQARVWGFPRLATYFDALWAIDPNEWFKGNETDIDNRHAAWLVMRPFTPTGRIPKYPYEVTFNAQDYGQVNYSLGTVLYRSDGSLGKLKMIYWRAGTMYDVVFEPGGHSGLEPIKITRDDGIGKQLVWGK